MRRCLTNDCILCIIILMALLDDKTQTAPDGVGLLDLRGLLAVESGTLDFDFEFEFIPDEGLTGITPVKPVRVTGTITNSAGYMRMESAVTLDYDTVCARCAMPLTRTLEAAISRDVAPEGGIEDEESEEYILIRGGTIDMRALAEEEIYLDFPLRDLCSPECKGLCPKCGKNLNEGPCSCPEHEPDPRLAVLSEWSKNINK